MDFFVYRRYRKVKIPPLPEQQQIQVVMDAHREALKKYCSHFYKGKITLFRSSQYYARDKGGYWINRWENFAKGGFECHVIKGDHWEIFQKPKFQELISKLKTCLDRAQFINHDQAVPEADRPDQETYVAPRNLPSRHTR